MLHKYVSLWFDTYVNEAGGCHYTHLQYVEVLRALNAPEVMIAEALAAAEQARLNDEEH